MKLGLVAIIFIVFLHLLGISVSEFHTNPNATKFYGEMNETNTRTY